MEANLYIDGGSRGNPGPAGCGFVVKSLDGKILKEGCAYLRRCTNNVAEYTGLIRGIELATAMGVSEINIFSDSELLVRQITGQYRVKSPDLKPMHERAERLLIRFSRWQIKHVRREFNADADRMANRAMDLGEAGKMAPDDLNRPAQQSQLDFAAAPTDDADPAPRAGDVCAACDACNDAPAADTGADVGKRIKVMVDVSTACGAECVAPMSKGQCFVFSNVTPAGLCIDAMDVLLPAVQAIQSRQHATRIVKCNRPGCSAVFKLAALPNA